MFASSLETDSAVIGVVHLLFSSLRQTRMWRAVLGRIGWGAGRQCPMSTGIQWMHPVSMWSLGPAEARGQIISPETKLWA